MAAMAAIGRRNGKQIPAPHSACRLPAPEITDGNIVPVDGFGRVEVDLDQPGHTTKMVKMDDVAYVPGTLSEPAVYYQSSGAMGETVNLL